MTQSVDQISIKDVESRRHNDPPGLWVAVFTSSVALHLLLFWLIRYSNAFNLWFPRDSQAIIPIEIIEISPTTSKAKPQLKAKTVSPPSANQQSSTVTPRNENSGGINVGAIRKQRERNTSVSKSNTQLVPKESVYIPKPIFSPTTTATQSQSIGEDSQTPRQPIGEDSQTPTRRTPRQPIGEDSQTPTRRTPRQPIGEDTQTPRRRTPRQPIGEDTQTPRRRTPRQPIGEDTQTPRRRTPRQPIGEDSQTPTRRTPRQPIGEDSQTPTRRTPRQPIGEDSQTPPTSGKTPQPATGGGIIAISRFLSREEQKSLMGSPLPEGLILPEHIGSNEKQIDSISLKPNLELPEKEFLVSLVIDETGNFQEASVVDRAIAPAERGKYQQFANYIFQGEKFQPARYQNGTPVLEWTNRFVRIKIQRR
ncbi:MAG: hypothetical protein KME54_10605 [Tolypothrix brevis GSE-NOS-MK-07-07A]|jgi:hypothetical protein|nr:hypothetical protein [Tolypothrix brevis GSE-NOS-MK-07-07A]